MEKKKDDTELVTRGYLRQELGSFKGEFDTFRLEVNNKFKHHDKNFEFIFKKLLEHDNQFEQIHSKLDKTIDIIQGMADKVTKEYQTFAAESSSIHFNYKNLATRTTKLEEVVFPNT